MAKTNKPKMQFSKMHVIFADLLVAFVYVSNVWLSAHGHQPVSDIAVSVITIYGGFATGGYFAQNCVRDVSLNNVRKVELENERMLYHEDQLETETVQP